MSFSKDDQQKYKALYIQTARDYADEILKNLQQLRSLNNTNEIITTLHREAHSLKGQSEMMGYHNIATLSALFEEIFLSGIESKKVLSEELVTKLVESEEAVKVCLDEIENTNNEIDLSQYGKDLHILIQTNP